jgi:hypothetical protein
MRAAFLTALGVLWMGGVVWLLVWWRGGQSGSVFVGLGMNLQLPKWVPHEVAFVATIAALVILLLGWTIPLAAGIRGILKQD